MEILKNWLRIKFVKKVQRYFIYLWNSQVLIDGKYQKWELKIQSALDKWNLLILWYGSCKKFCKSSNN